MAKQIKVQAGTNLVERAVHHHARGGGFLDIRYGFSLLLNRNVPLLRKSIAISLGIILAGVCIAFELPFESIVAGLLNLVGIGLDVILDGFELVAGPILFAAMLMPRLYRPRSDN
jgi:hypothetical protein